MWYNVQIKGPPLLAAYDMEYYSRACPMHWIPGSQRLSSGWHEGHAAAWVYRQIPGEHALKQDSKILLLPDRNLSTTGYLTKY
jgi:hypothetical protein